MAAGRVVFDDAPAMLTDIAARALYGMEGSRTPSALESGLPSGAASVVQAS